MPAFFRKERTTVFDERFRRPAGNVPCQLRGNLIFQAKNVTGTKRFRVRANGQDHDLIARVDGHAVIIQNRRARDTERLTINRRLTEADMARAVRGQLGDAALHAAAKQLCQDHATSSAHSPFISGTIVNNFASNRTFAGEKLCLELSFRRPFVNPWSSGTEQEYFLIGRVLNTECRLIKYYGRSDENLNEIVRLPGSEIPRPA